MIMKNPTLKTVCNILSPLTAVFLFVMPAFCSVLPSGGDYQIQSSVLDNGGGEKMTGGDYAAKGSIGPGSLPDNPGLTNGGGYANRTGFYNPPHFTYQGGLPLSFAMVPDDVRLTLPANSVGKEVFDITLNKNPMNQPLNIDPAKITNATEKLVYNEGAWSQLFPNNLSELSMFDEQSYYTDALAHRGTLAMRYKDDNNDGILDGSNPPVRASSLNAWGLDETYNTWVQLPGAAADETTRTIISYLDKPGVYAMLGSLVQAIPSTFKAFPVPFRPHGPQAGIGDGQTGTEATGITFEGVPQTGRIEIYTLDGRLVRKLTIPENLTSPYRVPWAPVSTDTGEKVASGVYIWRVVSGSNSKTGKLMVIW